MHYSGSARIVKIQKIQTTRLTIECHILTTLNSILGLWTREVNRICVKCGDYYSGSAVEVTPEMRAGHCSWCSHERGAKYHESSHSHKRINHIAPENIMRNQVKHLYCVGKVNVDVQQLFVKMHTLNFDTLNVNVPT